MKKLPVIALFATSAIFAMQSVAEANTSQYVETNQGWVSYHSGPSLSSPVVGRLQLNDKAPLVSQDNQWWYEIQVNGTDVYITTNSKYVHVVTEASPTSSSGQGPQVGETFAVVNPTYLYYTPSDVVNGRKAYLWDGLQLKVTSVVNADWMAVDVVGQGVSGYVTTGLTSVQPVTSSTPTPAPSPAPAPAPAPVPAPSWQVQAAKVIATAQTQLGAPYYWGHQVPIGSVPAGQPYGFDCSNFVAWSYRTALGIRFSGASEYQRNNVGTPVPLNQIRDGDLLFFATSNNPTGGGHVGLYMGNGMVIQEGGGWGKVTEEPLNGTWLGRSLVFARRVIN